ncbi:sensor histidine kinase [Flavobacterium pallidum]|uniref:histidine kinase n=1 Tax=Flavobacterium pallidum TaxID=2172098 RepID=A0A2S1SHB4_9FLAO|nr:histidine kinase [Flavobacterium pallidum]AWI25775.1 two-component sensor histidine kinase [Flavobacterium pallidum]
MGTNSVADNDVMVVIIYTSVAFLMMAVVLVLFYHFSRKKIVQHELEKRDLKISHQQDLLKATIITQEEERKRIAQDLHDDISSKLNIVSLNTHLLTTSGLSEIELSEITSNIIELTGKALENSRRIAHDLLPPVLEKFGLHAAIEELCHEFKTAKQAEIHFENKLPAFHVTEEEMQLQVFRVLQELLNNSFRHGKATVINICFEERDGRRTCLYSDNGRGFDPSEIQNKKGLGMKNIESRIAILNGNLNFDSAVNNGVQVSFTF